jgi:type IV pilus assembly protein PilP
MTHSSCRHWPLLLTVLILFSLSGCFERDVQEINLWMQEVERDARVVVPKLSEPKQFTPFAYQVRDMTDPFSPGKMKAELTRTGKSDSSLAPDLERRRELLESFPLDVFRMVGSLQKNGVTYALLQVERNVYRVELGQHIGQNFGFVTGISESAVSIKEIVQDAGGDWVERMAKVELQESMEPKK